MFKSRHLDVGPTFLKRFGRVPLRFQIGPQWWPTRCPSTPGPHSISSLLCHSQHEALFAASPTFLAAVLFLLPLWPIANCLLIPLSFINKWAPSSSLYVHITATPDKQQTLRWIVEMIVIPFFVIPTLQLLFSWLESVPTIDTRFPDNNKNTSIDKIDSAIVDIIVY
jgi:hypothetical protein